MPSVLLFDGECNLCSGTVRFILRNESSPALRFAALHSSAGKRILREHGLDPNAIGTLVLVDEGKTYTKSDAAIGIARHLRLPWRLCRMARVVPRSVRDRCYDVVARNRYRLFGRRDACAIPGADVASRFLD